MIKQLGRSAMNRNTQDAPLAALGSCLPPQDFFAPLREPVQLDGQTVIHTPHETWRDIVVNRLADCAALQQIHTRLRPDTARAAAWGRERVADQATRTRVREALTPSAVAQRRSAVEPIDRRAGQALPPLLAHDPRF
jgi:hypothetical protein